MTSRFRYALLFALSMTEMMPVALLAQALPAVLRRNGASLAEIGLLSFVLMPRAVKALWAPVVDKLGARSPLGRYRGWLLLTHPILLCTLLLGAYIDIPALLHNQRLLALAALSWLMIISATADTASHGMAVNLLSAEERGTGNGVQTAGMMLGNLIGGGLMMVLIEWIGWRLALLSMAICVMLPLPGILMYKDSHRDAAAATPARHELTMREIVRLFVQPSMRRWLGLLAVMSIGPAMIDICLQTLLVDRGFSLAEIGLAMGVIAGLAGAIGGAVGGILVKRWGRKRAFYGLTLLCSLCLASVLLTRLGTLRLVLYLGLALPIFGVVARSTLIYAMIMDRSRGHVASTDFTVQVSVVQVCGFVGLGLGSLVAEYLGTTAVFALAPLFTISVLAIAGRLLRPADFTPDPVSF